MLFALLAYLGGILTILSPCILPVLPFVFARSSEPFLKSGLPLLLGMILSFAAVASLAVVGGEAALAANSGGRAIALLLFTGFALLLIFPNWATRAMAPLVRLGQRLSGDRPGARSGIGGSLLLGVATGLLWAPCAGPILGLILTGAAVGGASATTVLLLVAYAAGAATSLALALLVGGRVFAAMKRGIGAGEWVRRLLGILILAAVAAIALGLDTRLLTRLSQSGTFNLEQGLARRLGIGGGMERTSSAALTDEGPRPALAGATGWLNSPPLGEADLEGKVVLVDFWTYSCINCIRAVPFIRTLHERYADKGLVVIGVHTPEFAFERDPDNVARAVREQKIAYPVAIDTDWAIWRAYKNNYWPATYIADAKGRIRYHHFGEGAEDRTEAAVRSLLIENGARLGALAAPAEREGAKRKASGRDKSAETYLGFRRMANFASPEGLARGSVRTYSIPAALAPERFAFAGAWRVEGERAVAQGSGARIAYRFRGRDLHLVLGGGEKKPIGFTVTIDGKAPGRDAGGDVDAAGRGTVGEHRLYQLVRQSSGSGERLFEIRFDDPGVEAYAFTFG